MNKNQNLYRCGSKKPGWGKKENQEICVIFGDKERNSKINSDQDAVKFLLCLAKL